MESEVEILKAQIRALKDLIAIKDQVIEALRAKTETQIFIAPNIATPLIQPFHTPAILPWPGFPNPYVGDFPGQEYIITCGNTASLPNEAPKTSHCVSHWPVKSLI